jgi:hypothetical protein
MSGLSMDQIKENERKIREELTEAETLEENAFEEAQSTEELLKKLFEAGLNEEAVREVIDEEKDELKKETAAVEEEEDAILREKQNLGMIAEVIHMVLEEEAGVEDEIGKMKRATDQRERPYKEEFLRDLELNAHRIADMLVTEAGQERAVLEVEGDVLKEVAFMISETGFMEDVDGLQGKEEEQTVGLGKKWSNKDINKVGHKLYQRVVHNEGRSEKEAEQEREEAAKLFEELESTLKEADRTYEEAENFINFLDFLIDEVGNKEFKENMHEARKKAEKAAKISKGDEEFASMLEGRAQNLQEQASGFT